MLLDILNWSHLQPSGVRHSSTSVDAAPPSPQEVRVEWGETCWGGRESFQVVSRSFFDYSILYTLCHDRRGKGGREGGRGDIKGFRNPKKAFKVLLYNADTKAAAATHCDRDSTSASPSYARSVPLLFSNRVRKTISNFHEKQSALCCHSTRATTSFH